MSQRKITITVCDSCGKNDYTGGIEIINTVHVKHGQKVLPGVERAIRIDVCLTCSENNVFVCYRCASVHRHEANCIHLWAERLKLPEAA